MAIVTLADAKTHLNITSTTNDDELTRFIAAAQSVVENEIGSVDPVQYTEVHNGGSPVIVTYHAPVISVDSLSEYAGNTVYALTNQPVGFSTSPWGYTLDDPLSGRITRRGAGSYPMPFLGGENAVTITYTAGRTTVPASVQLATLIIIAQLWQTQRGTASLPTLGGGDMSGTPVSTLIPAMAAELLEGSGMQRVPGIA